LKGAFIALRVPMGSLPLCVVKGATGNAGSGRIAPALAKSRATPARPVRGDAGLRTGRAGLRPGGAARRSLYPHAMSQTRDMPLRQAQGRLLRAHYQPPHRYPESDKRTPSKESPHSFRWSRKNSHAPARIGTVFALRVLLCHWPEAVNLPNTPASGVPMPPAGSGLRTRPQENLAILSIFVEQSAIASV
jgi:hypothetical protein